MKKNIIVLLYVLLSLNNLAQVENEAYSFFIAGHTYGLSGVNNPGLHPPFLDKFDYIQSRPEISFGVLTGDIVSANPVAQDWDEVDQDIENLGLPIYFAVGNHDMENRPLFEERYGDTYFNFIIENDLFIVLDPNLDGWSITEDQLTFLQNTLMENHDNVDNIFVFFHQILWREDDNIYYNQNPNSNAGREEPVNFWPTILPLFTAIENHTVFCAGDGGAGSWSIDFMYDAFDNIEFIASGMGEGIGDNFVVINVAEDKSLDYDLICLNEEELECFGELTDYQITLLDVNEIPPSKNKIYPNPVVTDLVVEVEERFLEAKMELINVQGEIVFTDKIKNNIVQISTETLRNGIYTFRLIDDKEVITKKLIIQH